MHRARGQIEPHQTPLASRATLERPPRYRLSQPLPSLLSPFTRQSPGMTVTGQVSPSPASELNLLLRRCWDIQNPVPSLTRVGPPSRTSGHETERVSCFAKSA